MRGFDNKALILFPYLENYQSKNYQYKYQFREAVMRLCIYLKSQGIEPHVFYSDDVAREISNDDFVWVSTLSRADSYFVSKYCDGMSEAMSRPSVKFEDIYNEVTAKYPGEPNMSVEQRFNLVSTHASKAISKIIPNYKIVFHFNFKNRMQYKVTSKSGDKKIRVYVDANTFIPEAYMGGNRVDACDLLAVPYANRSLTSWEI